MSVDPTPGTGWGAWELCESVILRLWDLKGTENGKSAQCENVQESRYLKPAKSCRSAHTAARHMCAVRLISLCTHSRSPSIHTQQESYQHHTSSFQSLTWRSVSVKSRDIHDLKPAS